MQATPLIVKSINLLDAEASAIDWAYPLARCAAKGTERISCHHFDFISSSKAHGQSDLKINYQSVKVGHQHMANKEKVRA